MREGIIVMVCIGLVLLLILNRGKDTPEEQRQFQEVGSAPAVHPRLLYWDKQILEAHTERDTLKLEQARKERDLVKKSIEKALGRTVD